MDASHGEDLLVPQPGKQIQFLKSKADICIYGGAAGGGKTYALLLEALRHIDNPRFEAVIFRQSVPQIMNAGGLYATSQEIYPFVGGESVLNPGVQWRFPSGAKVRFQHLGMEKEKYNFQGAQIPLIMFDELTHFSESVFFYMLSRNRSTCGVRPYIRATCNPDSDSWVADFISWWIDQDTGYPIEERSGRKRYFIRRNNIMYWGGSKGDLCKEFGLGDEEAGEVKSVSFISAKVTDNQILMKADPGYVGSLKAMSEFDQEQLLHGNWKVRPSAGHYFKRSKVQMLDAIPSDVTKWVRAWDLAASTDEDAACTAGVLMGKRSCGRTLIADVINVREDAAGVRQLIYNTAAADNARHGSVTVRIPQDPGQAGKAQAQSMIAMLGGFVAKAELESGDKVTRAEPLSAQWLAGNVDVLSAPWNDDYFNQLENFPEGKLKDMVDASANAYTELEQGEEPFSFEFF